MCVCICYHCMHVCAIVEMQLKEELEAAKVLSRAGTNPQVGHKE